MVFEIELDVARIFLANRDVGHGELSFPTQTLFVDWSGGDSIQRVFHRKAPARRNQVQRVRGHLRFYRIVQVPLVLTQPDKLRAVSPCRPPPATAGALRGPVCRRRAENRRRRRTPKAGRAWGGTRSCSS